jgi:ribosome-associated heat shock protein Hsp15
VNVETTQPVRIDKWLWAVRLFKTRTLAAAACRDGQVTIAGLAVKASRDVKLNDIIQAKTGDITRTVKVLKFLEKRVGAPLVKDFAEDLTPASEYEKQREPKFQPPFFRPKGAGRPTKKDRRDMDKMQ